MPAGAAGFARTAVTGGLRLDSALVASMVPQLTFEPSIGIAAAGISSFANMSFKSFKEPLERSVREVMIPSFRTNFEVGGRPPWEALSDATIRMRDVEGYASGPILVRSGKLESAATRIGIWSFTKTSAAILDFPLWYGKLHQEGFGGTGGTRSAGGRSLAQIEQRARTGQAEAGARPIPARPFIVMQAEDENEIEKIFSDWLEKKVGAHWARGWAGGV